MPVWSFVVGPAVWTEQTAHVGLQDASALTKPTSEWEALAPPLATPHMGTRWSALRQVVFSTRSAHALPPGHPESHLRRSGEAKTHGRIILQGETTFAQPNIRRVWVPDYRCQRQGSELVSDPAGISAKAQAQKLALGPPAHQLGVPSRHMGPCQSCP